MPLSRRFAAGVVVAGMLVPLVAPAWGSPAPKVRFGTPVYVDRTLAGGEPLVMYDPVHRDYIYTAHEGTTHLLRDGVAGASGSIGFIGNYRNQVNIWTSTDAVHWTRVNELAGFFTSPTINTGFSDPDLTEDAGGRIYDTGIDLVNDALFSSTDGGKTWPTGTINCHEGDRPWLAGGHRNEVFLATDPTTANGHTIYRSTDGGKSCASTGIGDYGPGYTGYGKLYYDRTNGALAEPVIYSNPRGIGVATLPHASRAFATGTGHFTPHLVAKTNGQLENWPAIAIDHAGTIYETWADQPRRAGTTGGCSQSATPLANSIYLAYSRDSGRTWSRPRVISHPGTTVLWPWVVAGSRGNVAVTWYQYDRIVDPDCATTGAVRVMDDNLYGVTTGHPRQVRVAAIDRPIHVGGMCQSGTTCVATGQDRRLGDFFTDALDAHGCVMIATGDTSLPDPITGLPQPISHPMFVRQVSGRSLTRGSCGPSARPGAKG